MAQLFGLFLLRSSTLLLLLRLRLRKCCLLGGTRPLLRHHGGDFHGLAVICTIGWLLRRFSRNRFIILGSVLLLVLGRLLLFDRILLLVRTCDLHLLGPEIGIEGIAVSLTAARTRRRAGIGSTTFALGADIGLLPDLLGNFRQNGIGILEKVRF
ncbi:hypothetical protein D3C87_1413520 [compost metagenome]